MGSSGKKMVRWFTLLLLGLREKVKALIWTHWNWSKGEFTENITDKHKMGLGTLSVWGGEGEKDGSQRFTQVLVVHNVSFGYKNWITGTRSPKVKKMGMYTAVIPTRP